MTSISVVLTQEPNSKINNQVQIQILGLGPTWPRNVPSKPKAWTPVTRPSFTQLRARIHTSFQKSDIKKGFLQIRTSDGIFISAIINPWKSRLRGSNPLKHLPKRRRKVSKSHHQSIGLGAIVDRSLHGGPSWVGHCTPQHYSDGWALASLPWPQRSIILDWG